MDNTISIETCLGIDEDCELEINLNETINCVCLCWRVHVYNHNLSIATPLLSLFTTLVLIMATWGKFVNIFIRRWPGGRWSPTQSQYH